MNALAESKPDPKPNNEELAESPTCCWPAGLWWRVQRKCLLVVGHVVAFRPASLTTGRIKRVGLRPLFWATDLLLILVLTTLANAHAVTSDEPKDAFKTFINSPPSFATLRFWVHHTPAKMGDPSWSNFYRLYDCRGSSNQFLISYYQKEQGLNLDFSKASYVHLRRGPNYWTLSPQAVNYWYDDGATNVDIQHTLRLSLVGDMRLLRLVTHMGLTQEECSPFTWKNDRFEATTASGSLSGEMLIRDGKPTTILSTNVQAATHLVDTFRIDYDWDSPLPDGCLPSGYTISRLAGTSSVPLTVVKLLEMVRTSVEIDLSQLDITNIIAEKYFGSNTTAVTNAPPLLGVYTNNALNIHQTNGTITSHKLRDPFQSADGPWRPKRVAFALFVFVAAVLPLVLMVRTSIKKLSKNNKSEVNK